MAGGRINKRAGVHTHGGKLRIWFTFEGRRCFESLGTRDTKANREIVKSGVCRL
jgi:hypothetical protein